MKKLTLLIITVLSLVGCQKDKNQEQVINVNEEQVESQSTLVNESEVDLETKERPAIPASEGVFNEKPYQSQYSYPASSLPAELGIDIGELRDAITEYYLNSYTEEEKNINKEPISDHELELVQKMLDSNKKLKPLSPQVDQITVQLAGETVYIARTVANMEYNQAKSSVPDNDVVLISETLAQVGNRLVMVCYYDEEAGTITPYHLTNRTNPLFTLDVE